MRALSKLSGSRAPRPEALALVPGATAAAALVVGQQIASKTARDALFLERYPVRELPKLMALAAVLSILAVYASSRLMPRFGPSRVMRALLIANGGLFAVEAIAIHVTWTAIGLYMHIAALGAVIVSGFWSIISERFDPHEARLAMGRIGAGATLGGALGGVTADGVERVVGARGLLIALGGSCVLAAFMLARLGENVRARPVARTSDPAIDRRRETLLGTLRETPHLLTLAAFGVLASAWAGLFDYAMKAEVTHAIGETSLVTFFGWLYTGTSVLTFVVQASLGDRILRQLGLTWAVALLPLLVLVGGLAGGLIGSFVAITAVRAGESVLANGIYRGGYELFFTPLASEAKRRAKTFVDVAAGRVGDALGGAIILVALAVTPVLSSTTPLAVACVAAVIALALLPRLHTGYVDALTSALKRGVLALENEETLDATTRRALAGSSELTGEGSRESIVATVVPSVATAIVLTSGDDERVRATLRRGLDPMLARLVLSLLGRPTVAEDAERALRDAGSRITGTLSDALTDPNEPMAVRLRIPRLLESIGDDRAITALSVGLEDANTEVRSACARALARMFVERPELRPTEAALRALAQRGLALEEPSSSRREGPPVVDDAVPFDVPQAIMLRLDPGAAAALTLLSPLLDRDALSLAVRALAEGDLPLRGTALEWIENVVEAPLREKLVARLGERPRGGEPVRRTERELRDALLRSRR